MYSDYKIKTLENGLRLLTVPMGGVGSVTVLAMVGVGSRYETEEQAGIAHFLEHMVFKGTENYPTAMDVSSAIDSVGGQYNAFTGKDYTGYYAKVASEHLELAVDVISDMLLTPRLREEDIEREKGVIVEELNMYEDDPRRKIDDIYDSVIYKGSHLGREIIGYKETVKSFSSSNFSNFLDNWYDLKNVVVVVAGDASRIMNQESRIEDLIEKAFSKGKVRSGKGEAKFEVTPQIGPQLKVEYKKTEQAHFYLGFPGLHRDHEQYYTQLVLSNILGGNSSARLFTEIREKRGLAYYAYASSEAYVDVGSLYAFEGVDPTRVDEAVKVTMDEFAVISGQMLPGAAAGATRSRELNRKELDRTKEYLRGKLILDWEDSQSVAITYARRALLSKNMLSLEDVLEEIGKVNLESVVGLAKKIIDFSKVNFAVIGPYEDEERFGKIINRE